MGDLRARIKAAQMRTDSALAEVEAKMNAQSEFIARIISEYKALLVHYIERHIETYHLSQDYWRAELVEAMRQLELSDSELLAFIKPDPPRHIAKPIKEQGFGHHCLYFPCPDCA